MHAYTPSLPSTADRAMRDESVRLARVLREPEPFVMLEELHREPADKRTGMTCLADGTDWDPGSGAGVYTYYGSAWNKLG